MATLHPASMYSVHPAYRYPVDYLWALLWTSVFTFAGFGGLLIHFSESPALQAGFGFGTLPVTTSISPAARSLPSPLDEKNVCLPPVPTAISLPILLYFHLHAHLVTSTSSINGEHSFIYIYKPHNSWDGNLQITEFTSLPFRPSLLLHLIFSASFIPNSPRLWEHKGENGMFFCYKDFKAL